jgi:hypothetical protein
VVALLQKDGVNVLAVRRETKPPRRQPLVQPLAPFQLLAQAHRHTPQSSPALAIVNTWNNSNLAARTVRVQTNGREGIIGGSDLTLPLCPNTIRQKAGQNERASAR